MQKILLTEKSHLGQITCKSHYVTENWFPDYINNSQNLTITKPPNKKWAKELNRHVTKGNMWMGKRYTKNAQHLWSLGKCKLEP